MFYVDGKYKSGTVGRVAFPIFHYVADYGAVVQQLVHFPGIVVVSRPGGQPADAGV